jgi:hypothetical protein
MADARDSKSRGVDPPWGFKSPLRHQPFVGKREHYLEQVWLNPESCLQTALQYYVDRQSIYNPLNGLWYCLWVWYPVNTGMVYLRQASV